MKFFSTACAAFALFIMSPATLHAQDNKTETTQEQPTREALNRKLSEISDDLTPEESLHFRTIYSNYSLISTVKTVRDDIQNAVQACGENNADMKADMDNRFESWKKDVGAVMEKSEANLNNMVLAQDYATKAEMDQVLKQIDDTRDHANSQITKIPVTTPEACTYLLNKMDETQQTMKNLLDRTLAPISRTVPKIEAAE